MYLKKYLMTIAAALCMLPLSAINPQNSKMKELNVKKVSVANIPVESVPALLDAVCPYAEFGVAEPFGHFVLGQ